MGVYDKAWDLTAEQADALFNVESVHHFHEAKCLCGFDSHGRARSATEHITDATLTALGRASTSTPDEAAQLLRRDIGRLSAARPDGMPTAVLAAALAAEGWVRPLRDGEGR